jgi:hypothetical protein
VVKKLPSLESFPGRLVKQVQDGETYEEFTFQLSNWQTWQTRLREVRK